jgi:hypothetical protein
MHAGVTAVLCMQEHGHLLSLQLMRKFVVRLQVWLAKHEDDGSLVQTPQGTEGLVGINCLTKIQVFLHQSLHLENHRSRVLCYSGGRVQEVGSKTCTCCFFLHEALLSFSKLYLRLVLPKAMHSFSGICFNHVVIVP